MTRAPSPNQPGATNRCRLPLPSHNPHSEEKSALDPLTEREREREREREKHTHSEESSVFDSHPLKTKTKKQFNNKKDKKLKTITTHFSPQTQSSGGKGGVGV